jgi:tetratricopeptide (TPR) repeat protein
MLNKFILGVIASLGLITFGFEAGGVESPLPNFPTSSSDFGTSPYSRETTIRLADGQTVRVTGKLAVLITQGDSALNRRDYNKTISLVTAALQANPERKIASLLYSWRAIAYSHIGQLDKALRDDDAAIELNPKDAIAYYNRAIHYANKRNYKLAIRDCNMAIQLNPKYADAYHNRGACYIETGDFEKAIADFSEAIRLDPRSGSTFYGRASAYEDIDKFDEASADYDQLIRIPPKDSDDYINRAVAHFTKGNYKKALSDSEKALRLSPNNARALGYLAKIKATCPDASLRSGQEAIRMATRACELTKWKEPSNIFVLAAAYAETSDFDQAVKYQTQGMKMKSAYGPVHKKTRERLALYQAHKPWRDKPLVAR